jgi:hypothetical protein
MEGKSTDHTSNSSLQATTADIAALAYALWQQRGCPEGSPENDWYEAERKLVSQTLQKERAAAGD